jgi:16S rRNA (guanine1207-N2)-methyltransferase
MTSILKSIPTIEHPRIVEYGAADTEMAEVFASEVPDGSIYLITHDASIGSLIEEHVLRRGLRHAEVLVAEDLKALPEAVDLVLLRPTGREGKERLRARIQECHRVLRQGGRVCVLTHKERGAESLVGMLRSTFEAVSVVWRGGGGIRVACGLKGRREEDADVGPSAPPSFRLALEDRQYEFAAPPGTFSKEHADPGSLLLLKALRAEATGRERQVLDLGCGYGLIGVVLASWLPQALITLVDVDVNAVEAADLNISRNGVGQTARAVLSDGLRQLGGERFDLVVSHLPLHIGARNLRGLIEQSRDALLPGGRFYAVALTEYAIHRSIGMVFGRCDVVAESVDHEGRSYTVCRSVN